MINEENTVDVQISPSEALLEAIEYAEAGQMAIGHMADGPERTAAMEGMNRMLARWNAALDSARQHESAGVASSSNDNHLEFLNRAIPGSAHLNIDSGPGVREGRAVLWADDELRALWRDAGGGFQGAEVETGTMAKAWLLPFLRSLASAAPQKMIALSDARIENNPLQPALQRATVGEPGLAKAAAGLLGEDLGDLRRRRAERELASYYFGDSVVAETIGRETDTLEDVQTKTLFVRPFDERSHPIQDDFAVEFAPKGEGVVSAQARINSVDAGDRSEAKDESSPAP